MRDWWLAIVVCLVLVVSVSLGPAVRERVTSQHTMDAPRVRSGSSDVRIQRDTNGMPYQQELSGLTSQGKMVVVVGNMKALNAAEEVWPQYVK